MTLGYLHYSFPIVMLTFTLIINSKKKGEKDK